MIEREKFKPDTELKLMEQVIQVLKYHHYSYRTEKAYCDWIVRFLKYFILTLRYILKIWVKMRAKAVALNLTAMQNMILRHGLDCQI